MQTVKVGEMFGYVNAVSISLCVAVSSEALAQGSEVLQELMRKSR